MLISFKVKNYLSFKDEAWFSMEANKKIRTLKDNKNIIKLKDWENIWLNKTAIFYGANASWKTNILKWLDFFKFIVLNSSLFRKEWIKEELPLGVFFEKFILNEDWKENFSDFEIVFLIDLVKYKYQLRIDENKITKEKLVFFEKNKEISIINRQITKWEVEEKYFWFYEDEFEKLNLFPKNNQTFLSLFANRETWEYKFTKDNKIIKRKKNIWLATKITSFFWKINLINQKSDFTWITLKMLKSDKLKDIIISFMKNADININNIKQEEKEVKIQNNSQFWFIEINWQKVNPTNIVEVKTDFIHPVYNNEWTQIWEYPFDFILQESEGTKKLFSFLWPILDTIKNNWILLIDEIDTHMHFLLIENLINFFHSKNNKWKNNIWNAQFIFNTHNLDLMDLELFKKDQIFFTSKDYYWATEIYSLDDFKDMQIRNNSDIKKAYKLWSFGAIPILSDFNL